MNLIATLTVAERFALSLEGLCRAVAGRIAGGAMAAAMIVTVWLRAQRVERQILAMLARFQAGRLLVGGMGRPGNRGGRVVAASGRLPRRFGWLLAMVPGEAAAFASQIQAVLAEPEMQALLAAAPRARRVLGPLCRMLGIEAEVLAGSGEVVSAGAVGGLVPGGGGEVMGGASLPQPTASAGGVWILSG